MPESTKAIFLSYASQDTDAFHWLDRAYQIHDGGLIYLKHDRFLTSLHGDTRYAELLKKLNLPP